MNSVNRIIKLAKYFSVKLAEEGEDIAVDWEDVTDSEAEAAGMIKIEGYTKRGKLLGFFFIDELEDFFSKTKESMLSFKMFRNFIKNYMAIEHAPKETSDQLIDALSEEQIGELFDLLQESVDLGTSEFEDEFEEEEFEEDKE